MQAKGASSFRPDSTPFFFISFNCASQSSSQEYQLETPQNVPKGEQLRGFQSLGSFLGVLRCLTPMILMAFLAISDSGGPSQSFSYLICFMPNLSTAKSAQRYPVLNLLRCTVYRLHRVSFHRLKQLLPTHQPQPPLHNPPPLPL